MHSSCYKVIRIAKLVLFLCAIFIVSPELLAGDESGKKSDVVPIPPAGLTETANQKNVGDPLLLDIPCEEIPHASVQSECWDALQRRFEYYEFGMDHRMRVFEWQHFSGRVIFGFVLLLVSTGIYFSHLQFQLYLRCADKPEGQNPSQSMDADLELSTTGVKVSSNVLGVVILVLSLAFFYLYLAFVYPIQETF